MFQYSRYYNGLGDTNSNRYRQLEDIESLLELKSRMVSLISVFSKERETRWRQQAIKKSDMEFCGYYNISGRQKFDKSIRWHKQRPVRKIQVMLSKIFSMIEYYLLFCSNFGELNFNSYIKKKSVKTV